jgi:alanine dehydrogenase
MTIILSNDDATELLSMRDCMTALEDAYRELALGNAVSATRSDAVCGTQRADTVYSLKLMGAVLPSQQVGVVRLNSDIISFGRERQVKLPLAPGNRYTGLVLLFDTTTGAPLAIFPDGILQRMRVGATSLLAARYLARRDVKTVALIGAGWQAGGHVMAVADTFPQAHVRCHSPTADKRAAFCAQISAQTGMRVMSVDSAEAAVRGADVVLCATNTTSHVFRAQWLEPGMHLSTIRGRELEPAAARQCDVIVVHEQSQHDNVATTQGVRIPQGRHAIEGLDFRALPSLAEVIAGKVPGRTSPEQTTCFVNLPGIGLQFAAVGAALYRKALAAGRGHKLPMEWFTEDVIP